MGDDRESISKHARTGATEITGIPTIRDLVHFITHIYEIVTDEAHHLDGTFICRPPMDMKRLPSIWQRKFSDLPLEEYKIDLELVDQMRSSSHSGFSIDNTIYLPQGDTPGLQRLAEFMVCCPFIHCPFR